MDDDLPSFEQAIAELQEIVERMERGDQSLDESVKDFERGMALSQICQTNLKKAEARVDKLVKKVGGVKVEEFEGDFDDDDDYDD